jgi:hypothetical protein
VREKKTAMNSLSSNDIVGHMYRDNSVDIDLDESTTRVLINNKKNSKDIGSKNNKTKAINKLKELTSDDEKL